MTPRENLLRVLRGEQPEWIPVTGHCDPYNQPSKLGMDPDLAQRLANVQWHDESTVIFSRYLDLDIADWFGMPAVRISRRNVTVEQESDGDTTTRIWHTQQGDLREVQQMCRDSSGAVSSNYIEHLVKGPEDLPALAAMFEDEVIEPDPDGFRRTRERRELIGDDGLVLGGMDGTPLGMMYRVYSGVATLAYLWADAPDALRDCFSVMESNYLKRLKIGIQSDIDVVVSVDDTSTTCISPAMFEAFNIDLTDARATAAHSKGKLYFHHSCGLIRDLLPIYRRTKMDAVHAFTVPPVGNVSVSEGRKLLGNKIAIWSGVGFVRSIVHAGKRAEAAVAIEKFFQDARQGNRLVVGVTPDPYNTMEEMRFVVQECRKAGGIKP